MKAKIWIPVITALIGLLGGLFPGYGPAVIDAIKYRGQPNFTGEWSGAFKEWCSGQDCPSGAKWVISIEHMKIKQYGTRVSASALTANLKPREWDISGRYRIPVLSMTYVDNEPAVMSVGAYVLESSPDCDKFHGYWLGYDRELKTLISCPYVLVKGQVDYNKIESDKDLKGWLNQKCFVPDNERNATLPEM